MKTNKDLTSAVGSNKKASITRIDGERELIDQRFRPRRWVTVDSWVRESQAVDIYCWSLMLHIAHHNNLRERSLFLSSQVSISSSSSPNSMGKFWGYGSYNVANFNSTAWSVNNRLRVACGGGSCGTNDQEGWIHESNLSIVLSISYNLEPELIKLDFIVS